MAEVVGYVLTMGAIVYLLLKGIKQGAEKRKQKKIDSVVNNYEQNK